MKITRLLVCAAILLCAASCAKDDVRETGGTDVAVKVTAGLYTRATDTEWQMNDAIGITMLDASSQNIVGNVYNYQYVTTTDLGSFNPVDYASTIYMPQNGNRVTFAAYYPYSANLSRNMLIPISTADQSVLPTIDLMTSEPSAVYSKENPNVNLTFRHRMSKMIFIFDSEATGQFPSLSDINVTIKGMKTEGTYDLLQREWTINSASTADMRFPTRGNDNERYGIVLPREAGPGATVDFTSADGSYYTANIDPDLELLSGYRYTFYVNLEMTPLTLSAYIEEWDDAPDTYFDAIQIGSVAGESDGFNYGARMNLYANTAGGGSFELLAPFTYRTDGTWYPDTPVYWEDIDVNPVEFKASSVLRTALNTTQMDDILLAYKTAPLRNRALDLDFTHAGSRVVVRLTSDNYENDALNSATITLPNYLTGAYEQNGELIPGTTRADILIDRSDAINSQAIIQPQTVASDDTVVSVEIGGEVYNAKLGGGFQYLPGTAYALIISVDKVGVSISASIIDWTEVPDINLTALTAGVPQSGGINILDGDVMEVFTGNTTARSPLTSFTYSLAQNLWTADPDVYWEDIDSPSTFYAWILRSAAYNDTQLADYLTANAVTQYAANGVHFDLSHPASKVVVQLKSSDGHFTDAELENMTVTLPGYDTGGQYINGLFFYGSDAGDILVASEVGENNDSSIAIIQPQTRPAGTVIAEINGGPLPYTVSHDEDIHFAPGVSTVLIIDINKTALTVSATVTDWEDGDTIPLTPKAITVTGNLAENDDFFRNKMISIYKLGEQTERIDYSYQYTGNGYQWVGLPLYWDDVPGQRLSLTAVHYPYSLLIPPVGPSDTSFEWELEEDQSDGYNDYDLITSHLDLNGAQYANFNFTHPLSGIRVEIVAPDFEPAELRNLAMTLLGFNILGTVDLATGSIANARGAADITPHANTNGYVYTALVMPGQTRSIGDRILSLKLPGYEKTFYGDLDRNITLEPGKFCVITLSLTKTRIDLSARYVDWVDGQTGNVNID